MGNKEVNHSFDNQDLVPIQGNNLQILSHHQTNQDFGYRQFTSKLRWIQNGLTNF